MATKTTAKSLGHKSQTILTLPGSQDHDWVRDGEEAASGFRRELGGDQPCKEALQPWLVGVGPLTKGRASGVCSSEALIEAGVILSPC